MVNGSAISSFFAVPIWKRRKTTRRFLLLAWGENPCESSEIDFVLGDSSSWNKMMKYFQWYWIDWEKELELDFSVEEMVVAKDFWIERDQTQ